jgi:hypothetical protein
MQRTQWLQGRRLGLAFAAVVALGIVLGPLATGGGGQSPSPIPQGCQLKSPQPEAPLKLNVVAVRRFVKSIAMEKEVFNCYGAESRLEQVRDVETFIEVIERTRSGGRTEVLAKRIDVVSCVKDLTNGRVSCRSEAMQLGSTSTPLARCTTTHGTYPFPELQQPAHPVEMETVVLRNGLVKTVKVEKEVFFCNGRIADLYLFTHVHESATTRSVRTTGERFDGVICFKDEARGRISECRLFTPRTAS